MLCRGFIFAVPSQPVPLVGDLQMPLRFQPFLLSPHFFDRRGALRQCRFIEKCQQWRQALAIGQSEYFYVRLRGGAPPGDIQCPLRL